MLIFLEFYESRTVVKIACLLLYLSKKNNVTDCIDIVIPVYFEYYISTIKFTYKGIYYISSLNINFCCILGKTEIFYFKNQN